MSLPFLPFARPEIGDAEIAEVVDTLRSGWLTTGPKAKRFEDDFSAYLGDYLVFVTVVTDPGSPNPALGQEFAADLLVKTVSALRG